MEEQAHSATLRGKTRRSGKAYLDDGFTPAILRHYLGSDAGEASFLHLATHFKVEKSLLLMRVGKQIKPAQILDWNLRLSQYDLLTLSACDSGVDAGAVASLGGLLR